MDFLRASVGFGDDGCVCVGDDDGSGSPLEFERDLVDGVAAPEADADAEAEADAASPDSKAANRLLARRSGFLAAEAASASLSGAVATAATA